MRVLVLNNYPLDAVWDEVRRGDKPDHHLYGLPQLQATGCDLRIVQPATARWLDGLQRLLRVMRWPIPMGHLQRQAAAWRELNEADVIYSPCGGEIESLAYLRGWGLVRTPIVALQHHGLNRGRLATLREPALRLQARGIDRWASLSQAAASQIAARLPRGRHPLQALSWGPDANFYPRAKDPGEGVLASGRTGRDFLTFGLGATRSQTRSPVRIVCLSGDRQPGFERFGSHVRVDLAPAGRVYTYPQMMRELLAARVLAIPLHSSPDNLAGLTSLVDALALGKPVIMTRNPFVDLDIEAAGIGRWVAAGDVQGWSDAIDWFARHPEESLAMGERARAMVDNGLHSGTFSQQVLGLLGEAMNHQVASPDKARA